MMLIGYLWMSGIFVWRVCDFLDDVRRLTPEIAPALHAHAHHIRAFFGAVTPVSVDVGVLERSDRAVVLPGDFGWDDISTWGSVKRERPVGINGNVAQGSLHPVEAKNNVVHAPGSDAILDGG